jgi:type VI secretion system secreted protein VgrG
MPGTYYEYGQHFKDSSEGDRLAKVRNEEIECARRVLTGSSNCVGFRSGFKFSLQDHYRSDLDGDYLLTHVNHFGSQGAGMGMGSEQSTYRNDFTCIPADVQYRPPRLTPEPRIPGIMTSKVETAGGDYAYIDDDGRYRVKMPFDLGSAGNGSASRAIRMAQPYSGPDYGIHFPNRANTEMVWACIDGNVDRPLGLSTVPNPSNKAPSVAGNKPQCVIRTAGQNELTFDDTIGSENIYLHGTKDWTIDIVNDKNQKVGNNETLSVGVNRDKSVGSNQTESVGANKSIKVGGNHSESISGNMTQSVSASKAETISAAKALTIGGAYQVTVGAAMNETVGAAKAEEIGGAKIVAVGAYSTEQVGGDKSSDVGGERSETTGKSSTSQIGEDRTIEVGKKMLLTVGEDFGMSGGKKGVVEIKDQLTIKCGSASITLKKNGDITIAGGKINVKASKDLTMKGSKIKQN